MAGMDLPVRAIREQIAGAIDLIVQQARLKDGTRRIIRDHRGRRHGGRRHHPAGPVHLRLRRRPRRERPVPRRAQPPACARSSRRTWPTRGWRCPSRPSRWAAPADDAVVPASGAPACPRSGRRPVPDGAGAATATAATAPGSLSDVEVSGRQLRAVLTAPAGRGDVTITPWSVVATIQGRSLPVAVSPVQQEGRSALLVIDTATAPEDLSGRSPSRCGRWPVGCRSRRGPR